MSERPEVAKGQAAKGATHVGELQNREIIDDAVRRIVHQFDPDQVILFGSYARGEADRDSDLDLLVVLPQVSSRRDVRVAIRLALDDIGLPKDVLVYTPQEMERSRDLPGSVVRAALTEGIVLYERAA
ncbi:MAG: nucleotidyltransferase domain-containing protein [Longimicrobiales bacterium]